MRDFVKALYVDLLHRIDVVVADITSSEHHPDIKDRFIAETLKQFKMLLMMRKNCVSQMAQMNARAYRMK